MAKYHISKEEIKHQNDTLVKTVCKASEDTPDFVIGVKDNCLVKTKPTDVETPISGSSTLVAGTVTVANTTVASTSRVIVTRTTSGGTVGHITVTKNAGVGFTITSSSNTETSTFDWVILN